MDMSVDDLKVDNQIIYLGLAACALRQPLLVALEVIPSLKAIYNAFFGSASICKHSYDDQLALVYKLKIRTYFK